MRGLALLILGGAFWLLVAAFSVSADGGPHIAAVNNGSGGLTADNCAGCHRAHTAPAADLLKVDASALCLSCHNGDGATTDVVNGVQYVPTGGTPSDPTHGSNVLGALRGGGFTYALINSTGGTRETYLSQTQAIVFAGGFSGSFTLTFTDNSSFFGPPGTAYTTGSITYAGNNSTTAGNILTALLGLPIGYTPGVAGLVPDQPDFKVTWSGANSRFQVALQNDLTFVKDAEPLMTSSAPGSITITLPSTPASPNPVLRQLGRVGVLDESQKQPVTSVHEGAGTVWGNGTVAQGAGVVLGGSDTLDCASCHNPHGSGTYRILRIDPGEDWASAGTPTFANGADVTVPETPPVCTAPNTPTGCVDPTTTVRNYTVLPANTATAAQAWAATQGDYLRKKVPAWNYTTLSADFDVTGWVSGLYGSGTPAGTPASPNVTTFCIACHTRYNGVTRVTAPAGAPQLVPNDPTDTHFTYKHGTENSGCLMCHVSHGSNALMTGAYSENYTYPDSTTGLVYKFLTGGNAGTTVIGQAPSGTIGTDYILYSGDSRLLKANNRGTCQLCHDPTETIKGGVTVGPTPSPIAP